MQPAKNSYKEIVKSTGIIGGSQILNIVIGIIKTKFIAIFLGPAGVGIAGILQTIVELIKHATGFGIYFSGIKSVAENNSDSDSVSRIIIILKRCQFATGFLGMLIIIFLCSKFSSYSFGNTSYAKSIAVMSVVVLLNAISAGQLASLQGLRRINEMAKATIFGSLAGCTLSIPILWLFGLSGIVPSMIITSIASLLISWYFAKKIEIKKIKISFSQTFNEGAILAKLGFFIVINGIVITSSLYIIRSLIRSHLDIVYVGYFQAVWTISTQYVNILINAMLADYFPRLSMVNKDNVATNKLINEQLEMTLLIGTPMLTGMIIFAPLILRLLYSSTFNYAIPILKWQMMASFFTFISWPISVIYLSRSKALYSIFSELLKQVIFIGFIYFGWNRWGFNTLGIGFFVANLVTIFFVLFSIRSISSFYLFKTNKLNIMVLGIILFLTFLVSMLVNDYVQVLLYSFFFILAIGFSYYQLNKLFDFKNWLINHGYLIKK